MVRRYMGISWDNMAATLEIYGSYMAFYGILRGVTVAFIGSTWPFMCMYQINSHTFEEGLKEIPKSLKLLLVVK